MQAPCCEGRHHLAMCNFVLEARKKYYTAKQFSKRDPGHQEEWTMCALDHIHHGNSNSSNVLLRFQNQWEERVSLYHSSAVPTVALSPMCWNAWEGENPHDACFCRPRRPSMPPWLEGHPHTLLAAMTPYCHPIRCVVPHGLKKYLGTTT